MGKILAFLGDPSEAFSKRRVFDLEELIRTLIAGQEDSIFLVGNETLFDKDVSTAVQNIRKTGCEKFRLCLVLAKHLEGDLLDEYKK